MDKETRGQIGYTILVGIICSLALATTLLIHPLLFFIWMPVIMAVDYLTRPPCPYGPCKTCTAFAGEEGQPVGEDPPEWILVFT
jgi:hypothetical protein